MHMDETETWSSHIVLADDLAPWYLQALCQCQYSFCHPTRCKRCGTQLIVACCQCSSSPLFQVMAWHQVIKWTNWIWVCCRTIGSKHQWNLNHNAQVLFFFWGGVTKMHFICLSAYQLPILYRLAMPKISAPGSGKTWIYVSIGTGIM